MDNINNVMRSSGRLGIESSTIRIEDLSEVDTGSDLTVFRRDPPPTLLPRSQGNHTSAIASGNTCPICRGAGFFLADVQPGHPDFGKALSCECKKNEQMWRRIKDLSRTNEFLTRYRFENFNSKLTRLSLPVRNSLQHAFDASLKFSRHPEGWLILTGTYGCGKTHLAAAIANERIDRGQPVVFVVVPDLLDHLRTTFGPNSEVQYDQMFEQVRSTRLLILDDFGAQSATPWAQEKLFQILNHRYNAQLPTVITTNQRINTIEERIRSRILDSMFAQMIFIGAPDYRRQSSEPLDTELSSLNWHKDKTFENFIVERRNLNHKQLAQLSTALNSAVEYSKNPKGMFLIQGLSGTGKTHLAAAIANYQVENYSIEVLFVSVADLLDYLRAAFDPQSPTPYDRRFEDVKKSRLLVLDNLGMESATAWAKEKLFQLIDYRHNTLLPTVITTRLSKERIDPWLETRLADLSRSVWVKLEIPEFQNSTDQQELIAQKQAHKKEIDFFNRFNRDERSF